MLFADLCCIKREREKKGRQNLVLRYLCHVDLAVMCLIFLRNHFICCHCVYLILSDGTRQSVTHTFPVMIVMLSQAWAEPPCNPQTHRNSASLGQRKEDILFHSCGIGLNQIPWTCFCLVLMWIVFLLLLSILTMDPHYCILFSVFFWVVKWIKEVNSKIVFEPSDEENALFSVAVSFLIAVVHVPSVKSDVLSAYAPPYPDQLLTQPGCLAKSPSCHTSHCNGWIFSMTEPLHQASFSIRTEVLTCSCITR